MSAFDTKFMPRTSQRFILRCRAKKCRTVHAFDCLLREETRYDRGIIGVPGSARPYTVRVPILGLIPDLYCITHRWPLSYQAIKGTVTECPCDGRCTSAKGPNCDCSCGGQNHGSDYL